MDEEGRTRVLPGSLRDSLHPHLLCQDGAPDGGWYDELPPRVVATSPAEGATDVNSRRILISFDEFIVLQNATENVVVSPPQLEAPVIKVQGKRISVQLQDSLIPNTTYTIDFSDAISDNNEGNPMGNYTYTFSTGQEIDTLEIAAMYSMPKTWSREGNTRRPLCQPPRHGFRHAAHAASGAYRQQRTLLHQGREGGRLPRLCPPRPEQRLSLLAEVGGDGVHTPRYSHPRGNPTPVRTQSGATRSTSTTSPQRLYPLPARRRRAPCLYRGAD